MIGCFVAAVIIGYFGKFLPEDVKTGITEYVLLFLKDGFLNLLNTCSKSLNFILKVLYFQRQFASQCTLLINT